MKKTREKKPLEQKDIELLDEIISRLDQLILWQMAWGILGIINGARARDLEKRLRNIRIRETKEKEFPITKLDEGYELNKEFFCKLSSLLNQFADHENLGTEFDKRRARRFAEIAIEYNRILENEGAVYDSE